MSFFSFFAKKSDFFKGGLVCCREFYDQKGAEVTIFDFAKLGFVMSGDSNRDFHHDGQYFQFLIVFFENF